MQIKIIIILASIIMLLISSFFVYVKIESQKKEIETLKTINEKLETELFKKNMQLESASKQCEEIEKIEVIKEKDYNKNEKVIETIKKAVKDETGKAPEKVIIENIDDWAFWNRINELFGVSDSPSEN